MTRIDTPSVGIEEPVVLLHSSGGSCAQWRALVQQLGDGFHVIAPDLCGYGFSPPWSGEAEFTLAHEAAAVLALIGRTGQPVHLVGHSYGGAVALHIARMRSDLLRSLTVIEPVAFHLLRGGNAEMACALAEIEEVTRMVVRSLANGNYERGSEGFIDYWSCSGAWAALPAEKRAAMRGQLAKVALDFQATLNEPAGIDDFGMVAVPALVVQGGRTKAPTRLICERLAAVLPDAQLQVVEGAGHMAPLTHRNEVNDLVLRHIRALACSQAATAVSASFAAAV